MPLPDKFYSYDTSIISRFSLVLRILGEENITVSYLYEAMKNQVTGVSDFIEILDALFAMKKIKLNERGELYRC